MIVAAILEIIGAVLVLLGLLILGFALSAPMGSVLPPDLAYQYGDIPVALGRLIIAIPGFSLFVTGLLLVAAGRAVDLLRQIARTSRETTELLDQQFNPRA